VQTRSTHGSGTYLFRKQKKLLHQKDLADHFGRKTPRMARMKNIQKWSCGLGTSWCRFLGTHGSLLTATSRAGKTVWYIQACESAASSYSKSCSSIGRTRMYVVVQLCSVSSNGCVTIGTPETACPHWTQSGRPCHPAGSQHVAYSNR
jgi:hypothetical protein